MRKNEKTDNVRYEKYLDKRITLYLRGIKAIAIYHADEDYYALDLAGVVYSLKTKRMLNRNLMNL